MQTSILFFVLLAAPTAATNLDPSARVREFVANALQEVGIPGIAVSVVEPNGGVYTEGFGVKQVHRDNKVDGDTLFQIGSCTKTFIALGLAKFVGKPHKLLGQNRFTWATKVIDVLPNFKVQDTYVTANLNFGDVLTHSSGLVSPLFVGPTSSESQAVNNFSATLPQQGRLGLNFSYNNFGYEIATVGLEALAGQPWYEFAQDAFWLPLGMNSTYPGLPAVPESDRQRLAYGHLSTTDGEVGALNLISENSPSAPLDFGCMSEQHLGAGSVVSSARDFAKWMDFLLHVNGAGEIALTEAQTGQHVVGTDWARLMLYGDPSVDHIGDLRYDGDAGDVAAAGFGFDLIGTLFERERFVTKGGDTGLHKIRMGLLPGDSTSGAVAAAAGTAAGPLGVAVLANMQRHAPSPWATGYEVALDGIRNVIMMIYRGANDTQVQQEWTAVSSRYGELNAEALALPNQTVQLPMRDGSVQSFDAGPAGENPYGWMLPVSELDGLIAAASEGGVPAQPSADSFLGGFRGGSFGNWYGQVEVSALSDGQLKMQWGCVSCTLSMLQKPAKRGDPVVFICPNATRHYGQLFSIPPLTATFAMSGGDLAATADANSRPMLQGRQPPLKYDALELGSYGTELPFPGLNFVLVVDVTEI